MIERDDRRGLGEAVALNDDESELAPERFELGVERRRADDERPELPAEHPMHVPVAATSACANVRVPPRPAAGVALPSSTSRRSDAQSCSRSTSRIFGTDTSTEIRRVLICVDDLPRVVAAHEHDDARQHRRNEGRHRLAEHVAERQQVQEPNRKERLCPTSGTSAPRARPGRCSPARCDG